MQPATGRDRQRTRQLVLARLGERAQRRDAEVDERGAVVRAHARHLDEVVTVEPLLRAPLLPPALPAVLDPRRLGLARAGDGVEQLGAATPGIGRDVDQPPRVRSASPVTTVSHCGGTPWSVSSRAAYVAIWSSAGTLSRRASLVSAMS